MYEEVIAASINYHLYSSAPEYRWIDIGGTKALEFSYAVPIDTDRAEYKSYFLFNTDEIVTLSVGVLKSKSKSERATDIINVIRTINWVNPK